MCLSNLIQILPTTQVTKTTDKIERPPFINNQGRPAMEYSKQELLALRHNNVNLTRLPTGTKSTIRRLKLNKKRIRKTKQWEQIKQTGVNFCNLHQVQTVNEDLHEKVNTIRAAHVNARSIKNKDDLISEYIESTKIDFTIITETWLQDNKTDKGWVSTTVLNNSGYKMSTENWKTGKGGGIVLVMREKYYVKKAEGSITYDSFDHAIWSTKIRNKDYTLIGIITHHRVLKRQSQTTISSPNSQNS